MSTTQAREGIVKVHDLCGVSLGEGRGRGGYLESCAMLDGEDLDRNSCGDVLCLARDRHSCGTCCRLCRLDHKRGEEKGARDERDERKPG